MIILRKLCIISFILVVLIFVTSCTAVEEEYIPEEPAYEIYEEFEIEEEIEEEEEEIDPFIGYSPSHLTGLWVPDEVANRRPFAVLMNNEPSALPQSAITNAEIVYEILAEGNITRLLAIFHVLDESIEKVGPLRSTRHYFAPLVASHNAIFVHHGGSVAGYNHISTLGINNIDGMVYDGSTIFRYAPRRQARGLEHSSYTSFANLLARAETRNFELYTQNPPRIFNFFDEPTVLSNNPAQTVNVRFTNTNVSRFEFNEQTNLYYKYIFGNPHMDYENDNQVAVSNIIVQITDISVIPGDAAGRRQVRLLGRGEGFLASMGSYIPIYWQRDSYADNTIFFDTNGNEINLNKGQTWISIVHLQPEILGGEEVDE